ncbi:hypothetical protein PLICRDRAFT_605974 [Plicaturopsis crispa FD-325 SS-3]|nr:hypothetical protein PLICRDRAFT_605974 [Plicaturopsis crispa FD-325 SS-3]
MHCNGIIIGLLNLNGLRNFRHTTGTRPKFVTVGATWCYDRYGDGKLVNEKLRLDERLELAMAMAVLTSCRHAYDAYILGTDNTKNCEQVEVRCPNCPSEKSKSKSETTLLIHPYTPLTLVRRYYSVTRRRSVAEICENRMKLALTSS